MQAIILAAGKGTRLGQITQETPKSLVRVAGNPILEHILFALPQDISEVIVATGHLGDKVQNHIGGHFNGLPVKFVVTQLDGTGGTVWSLRNHLKGQRFLVLNGDDIYHKSELAECLKHDLAFGLSRAPAPGPRYISISVGSNGDIIGHERAYIPGQEINIATGAYVLDPRIFNYDLVKLSNGEYGLPQTALKMVGDHKIKAVFMNSWHQVNSPEDIKKAERAILSKL